jgi:hypothetical protein
LVRFSILLPHVFICSFFPSTSRCPLQFLNILRVLVATFISLIFSFPPMSYIFLKVFFFYPRIWCFLPSHLASPNVNHFVAKCRTTRLDIPLCVGNCFNAVATKLRATVGLIHQFAKLKQVDPGPERKGVHALGLAAVAQEHRTGPRPKSRQGRRVGCRECSTW